MMMMMRMNFLSRHSGGWLSTIITWGVIAWIVYYIYQRFTYNQSQPYPTFITFNVLCVIGHMLRSVL